MSLAVKPAPASSSRLCSPGQVWLASPPTVMASALAGELLSFEQLRARWRLTQAIGPGGDQHICR